MKLKHVLPQEFRNEISFNILKGHKNETIHKNKIRLLCGIFIAFLLLVSSSLLWSLSGVVERFRSSVEISGKVIKDAQFLQQVIIDAETGQRGYIITGKFEFLEPYTRANKTFKKFSNP